MALIRGTRRGRAAQRPVGDLLKKIAAQSGYGDTGHESQDDREDRVGIQEICRPPCRGDRLESLKGKIAAERADHHDVAMREVDHEQDAVDQRIPDGDQGIDAAENEAGDRKAQPGIRTIGGVREQHLVKAPEQVSGKDDAQYDLDQAIGARRCSDALGGWFHLAAFPGLNPCLTAGGSEARWK